MKKIICMGVTLLICLVSQAASAATQMVVVVVPSGETTPQVHTQVLPDEHAENCYLLGQKFQESSRHKEPMTLKLRNPTVTGTVLEIACIAPDGSTYRHTRDGEILRDAPNAQ